MKSRSARGVRRPIGVKFTSLKVAGSNGAGWVDLTSGTITGPFVPDDGDVVVSILEGSGGFLIDSFKADDVHDFASVVGARGQLRQLKAANLSTVSLFITLARRA